MIGRVTRTWRRWIPSGHVRVRVTLAATLVAAIGAGVGSVVFTRLLHENLELAVQTSARQQLQAIAAQLARGASPEAVAISGQDDVVTQVVSANGQILATDRPQLTRALRTTPGFSEDVPVSAPQDTYAVLASRSQAGDLIVVGRSEEHVRGAVATTAALLGVAVPLSVLLLGLVVWFSIGRALRPVEAMRRQASEISSEHLHRRLPVPSGSDEIALLARTLNGMLKRIDSAQQLQRQFVADASHELRSPLAAMRQLLEVAQKYPGSISAEQLASEALPEERRMEDLVAALLTLARLDDDGRGGHRSVVDLDEIVAVEVPRLRLANSGLRIDASRVNAAQVRGNPVLLAQAVRNVLSNAARHAQSTVGISLGEVDREVRLEVDDDGNGIAPESRELVFQRFVRLDEARDRDHGGSGLGLAIVRRVVETCGGRVWVDDSPRGGARFVLVFPAIEVSRAGEARQMSATRPD